MQVAILQASNITSITAQRKPKRLQPNLKRNTCRPTARTPGQQAEGPVALFWDLDNLPVSSPSAALLTATRLKLAVERRAGPVTTFRTYGNSVSFFQEAAVKGQQLKAALCLAASRTFTVCSRRNAADVLLRSHATEFAKAARGGGCIAFVTADNDYSGTACYCRSLGCQVIVIGMFGQIDALRPLRWTKARLAREADIAMLWSNAHPTAVSAEERASLMALKDKVPPDAKAAHLVARSLHPATRVGSVLASWPPAQEPSQAQASCPQDCRAWEIS